MPRLACVVRSSSSSPASIAGSDPSAEQDRDRVGIALDIQPAQQVGDPPVGGVERAADDGDVAPGARKPRIDCLPPAFEPHGDPRARATVDSAA